MTSMEIRTVSTRARFENKHLLIKLHGDINDPWNMVLTKSAYDKCYGGDPEVPDLEKPMPAYLSKQVNIGPCCFWGAACIRIGPVRSCIPTKVLQWGSSEPGQSLRMRWSNSSLLHISNITAAWCLVSKWVKCGKAERLVAMLRS